MTKSVQEVYDTDPLDLDDPDMDVMIADMRSKRGQFIAGNAKAGKTPKAAKVSEEDQVGAVDLLKDLGL